MIWQLYLVPACALAVCVLSVFRFKNGLATTKVGAKLALDHVGDWAKWMSGIQTAGLGALAFLVMDEKHAPVPFLSHKS